MEDFFNIDIEQLKENIFLVFDLLGIISWIWQLKRKALLLSCIGLTLVAGICLLGFFVLTSLLEETHTIIEWMLTAPLVTGLILFAAMLGPDFFESKLDKFGGVGWLVVFIVSVTFSIMACMIMLFLFMS